VKQIEHRPPPEYLAEGFSVRFTGGCAWKGKWFQTTSTELVIFDLAHWSKERVISHSSFNDVHGVAIDDDEIAIVNTGLELIQFLDHRGKIVREVNVASQPTWERFDRNTDYRKVESTKPHEVHVNHAFKIDGQWWATRCLKSDAINLENPNDRIEIPVGQPHDGIVRGDFVYFTTTNGHVVIADVATRKVCEVIDVNELDPVAGLKGWCRGLEIEGDFAYVGFTRFRRSKWRETFRVVKDMVRGASRISHINKINLKHKKLVETYTYDGMNSVAIFALADYDRVIRTPQNA